MSNRFYYVYIFLDPRKPGRFVYGNLSFNFEPFYIGKGRDSRYRRHLNNSRLNERNNTIKTGKLKNILAAGYNPLDYVVILFNNLTNEIAQQEEMRLIKLIGRIDLKTGPLANLTEGGEGMHGNISLLKGKSYEDIHGIERARALRESKRLRFSGTGNPQFGKPSWMKGKHLSLERKEKLAKLRSLEVRQLSLDGELIALWDSPKKAAQALGISSSAIYNVLAERMPAKRAGGFRWEYVSRPNLKYL